MLVLVLYRIPDGGLQEDIIEGESREGFAQDLDLFPWPEMPIQDESPLSFDHA